MVTVEKYIIRCRGLSGYCRGCRVSGLSGLSSGCRDHVGIMSGVSVGESGQGSERSHCFRRARFASASASCRAFCLACTTFQRQRLVAALEGRSRGGGSGGAMCLSSASGGHFGDQNSFGRVSCFTFRWVAVFRVSLFGRQPCFVFHFSPDACVSRVSCFSWTGGETPSGANFLGKRGAAGWPRRGCR